MQAGSQHDIEEANKKTVISCEKERVIIIIFL